jgi:hypothetical protein
VPGQPDPAHDVDFEHPGPIGVLDVKEALRVIDAEIVDEDVDLGELLHQRGAARRIAEIERCGVHLGRRRSLLDFRHGLADHRLIAPVDDHLRAHLR